LDPREQALKEIRHVHVFLAEICIVNAAVLARTTCALMAGGQSELSLAASTAVISEIIQSATAAARRVI
jgi:hypothetical protein